MVRSKRRVYVYKFTRWTKNLWKWKIIFLTAFHPFAIITRVFLNKGLEKGGKSFVRRIRKNVSRRIPLFTVSRYIPFVHRERRVRRKSSFIPVRGFTLPVHFPSDSWRVIGARDAFIYSAFKQLAPLPSAYWSACYEGSKSIRSSRHKYTGRTNRCATFAIVAPEGTLEKHRRTITGQIVAFPFEFHWFFTGILMRSSNSNIKKYF